MSARLTITCPLLADATRGPARDGTEEILNSSSGSCQPLESLLFLPRERHAMSEVTLDRQPWEAGGHGQFLHLVGLQRPANRQRAVVMEDGMERLGEQPGPDVGTARPHEVVDDDATSREPVERL